MAQSIKLGSDTYLDSSGVAITNTGKTLQNFVNGYSGTYTPTFTFSDGTGSVDNINVRYVLRGGMLYISGRFNVTTAPSVNSFLQITLPTISGVTMTPDFVGGVGTVGFSSRTSQSGTVLIEFRVTDNTKITMMTSGGGHLFPSYGTGYYVFGVLIPVSIT